MKFKNMNLPNKLTTIRMFCVPLMVVLFILFMLNNILNIPTDYIIYKNESCSLSSSISLCQILMVIIFAFASITDFIDGYLARKHNLVSDYGKLMDPLADKLLVNTTIISMMVSKMYFIYSGVEIISIIAVFFFYNCCY